MALFRGRGNAAAAELCERLAREAPWKAKEEKVMRQFGELRKCLEARRKNLSYLISYYLIYYILYII